MAANLKLPKLEGPSVNLGSLMYMAIRTQPNIMYAIHYLSQHSIAPRELHLNAMKCVYCYLIGTQDLGLVFHSD